MELSWENKGGPERGPLTQEREGYLAEALPPGRRERCSTGQLARQETKTNFALLTIGKRLVLVTHYTHLFYFFK